MRLSRLLGIAGCLLAACQVRSEDLQKLLFRPGQDTIVGTLRLRLENPDNSAAPTLWEGPLRITRDARTCEARVSLVTAVWAAPHSPFAIIVTDSGSSTYVHFIDTDSCAAKWPRLKVSTEGVKVAGDRLQILGACTCEFAQAPCTCTAAQVYRLQSNRPPSVLEDESKALTKQQLGVDFTGTRQVLQPKTPQARLQAK